MGWDAAGRAIDADGPSDDDREFYKQLSGNIAKGVAVVTCLDRGWDHAAIVTDYLSVSYDPPTMLVSLYSLSRMVDAIEGSGRWALNILSSEQAGLVDRLGQPGAPLVGLLDQIPHSRRDESAPALITGALAWFELRSTAAHEAATHKLFVGEVTWLGQPDGTPASPLVHFRSEYNRM